MSKQNNGGSAFPYSIREEGSEYTSESSKGMTIKDYFAGQAIIGIIANSDGLKYTDSMANAAYEIADSMLKERQKQAQPEQQKK